MRDPLAVGILFLVFLAVAMEMALAIAVSAMLGGV